MSGVDRLLATVTSFVIGAAIALIVAVITPGSHGGIVGWMILGGVAGMLIGLPLWTSVWKRQQLGR